jgi:hypothetical protein
VLALATLLLQEAPEAVRRSSGQRLAWALLALALAMLALLSIWLVVSLRRGRRLRRQAHEHTPTTYTDAWAEAGRRMPVPPSGGEGTP